MCAGGVALRRCLNNYFRRYRNAPLSLQVWFPVFYECRNAPLAFAKQNWNRSAAARNVFTGVGTRHCYSQNRIRTVQSWHNFYKRRNILLKISKEYFIQIDGYVSNKSIHNYRYGSVFITARRRRKIWWIWICNITFSLQNTTFENGFSQQNETES